jgi:hypothetical protein
VATSENLPEVPPVLIGGSGLQGLLDLFDLKVDERRVDVSVAGMKVGEDLTSALLVASCVEPSRAFREQQDAGYIDGGEADLDPEGYTPGNVTSLSTERDGEARSQDLADVVK